MTGMHAMNTVATKLAESPGLSAGTTRGSGQSSAIGSAPFGDLLADAIGNVNQLEDQARAAVDGFMTGKGVDVHTVMIASEKASMAFEGALALRNKAVQSYQSVMSMQF